MATIADKLRAANETITALQDTLVAYKAIINQARRRVELDVT